MAGVPSYKTIVKYGGTPTEFTDEDMERDSEDDKVYQIIDDTKRVLNRTTDSIPEVKIDDSVQDSKDYTVDYLFGKVHFDSAPADGAAVTISGEYIPVGDSERVSHCHNHDITLESELLDTTGYKEAQDSNGHRLRILGLEDGSATLSRFDDGAREFKEALDNKDPVLIEVRPGGGDLIFRGWFVTESVNFSGGVEDLEDKEISLQLDTEELDGDVTGFGWSD